MGRYPIWGGRGWGTCLNIRGDQKFGQGETLSVIISLKLKLFKGVALITELLKQLCLQNKSLANLA